MTKNARHENLKKKASPRGKRKLDFIDKKKARTPLSGKLIFLDIKVLKVKRRLEDEIKRLGAVVEPFLSKDINYLITSNPPVKVAGSDGSADSPSVSTPSPFNVGPSPSPGTTEPGQKSNPNVYRGKAIYNKAKINAQSTNTNTVVDNAQRLGVKIVGLDAAQKWIQKEVLKLPQPKEKPPKKETSLSKKGSIHVKKLTGPFVKFEDSSLQYRAVYQHIDTWPHINIDTPKGTCPFDGTRVGKDEESVGDRQDKIGIANADVVSEEEGESKTPADGKLKKSDGIVGPVKIMTAGEIRRQAERKKQMEKKRGYCECCLVKYENVDVHLRDEQHKNFIRNKKNYESLDNLIKTGTNCNTAKFLQRTLNQYLRKGKKECDNVDVSIPESKQWTPRKSGAAKLIAKASRQSNNKTQGKSFTEHLENSSKVKLQSSLSKESSCRLRSPKVIKQDANCDSLQKTDEVNRAIDVDDKCDTTSVGVTDQLDQLQVNSPVHVSVSALNLNTSGVSTGNDLSPCPQKTRTNCDDRTGVSTGTDRSPCTQETSTNCDDKTLDNAVICNEQENNRSSRSRSKNTKNKKYAKVKKQLQAKCNELKADPSANCNELKDAYQDKFDEVKSRSQENCSEIKDKNKATGGEMKNAPQPNCDAVTQKTAQEGPIDISPQKSKVREMKDSNDYSTKLESVQLNQLAKSNIKGSQNKNKENKDTNISPRQHSPTDVGLDNEPNEYQRKSDKKVRKTKENVSDEEGRENAQGKAGNDDPSSRENITAKNKVIEKLKDTDVPKRENGDEGGDFNNHYVPKLSRSVRTHRTISPNRVDWGDTSSTKSSVAKIVKRWSQKLTSNKAANRNHVSPTTAAHDEADCMEVDPPISKDTHGRPKRGDLNKSEEIINNLAKKYCDESKVYLSREELVQLSPKGPGSNTKLKQENKRDDDIYDFKESPLNSPMGGNSLRKLCQKKDEYDLSSDVSLIAADSPKLNRKSKMSTAADSPKLNRKNKTPTSAKRTRIVNSPKSGYSLTPRSSQRKTWRKHTPKCLDLGSKGKKLSKLKYPEFSNSKTKYKQSCSDVTMVTVEGNKDGSKKKGDHCKPDVNDKPGHKQQVTKSASLSPACSSSKDLSKSTKNKCPTTSSKPCAIISVSNTNCSSPIPKSLMQTLQKRNLSLSPSGKSRVNNRPDAIQRISPSKPFKASKVTDNDSPKQKTPNRNIQKPVLHDSGNGSSKSRTGKSPGKRLCWKSAELGTKRSKKLKLNKSWSLLSDRSIGKLLESENDEDCFEGFTQEDITGGSSLGSDASYVETTEIDLEENSREEWVMDADVVSNEDSNQGFRDLMPLFSSPGKRSDSSWDDACDMFIKSQVSFNTSHSKSMHECFSSPSKINLSGRKRKRISSVKGRRTPKRKRGRLEQESIERVDKDIVFNHMSPQKLKQLVSPVTATSSGVVLSSSPLKAPRQNTSTPFRGLFSANEEDGGVKENSVSAKSPKRSKSSRSFKRSKKRTKAVQS